MSETVPSFSKALLRNIRERASNVRQWCRMIIYYEVWTVCSNNGTTILSLVCSLGMMVTDAII